MQHFIGGGAKLKTSCSRKGSVADERNDVNDDDDEALKQQRQMLAELQCEHALELEQLQSEHAASSGRRAAELYTYVL